MGYRWRARSFKLVMEEIKLLVNDFGAQMIEFEDDNLLHDMNRAFHLFDAIARFRKDHTILLLCSFPNGVRIDKLNLDLLKLMKKAGIHKIVLPVEHGDIRIRQKMGKPLTNDQIYKVCEWASMCGISIEVFVMIGYPGETDEIFNSGLQFLKEIGSISNIIINYLFPQPYTGTKLRQECLENNYDLLIPDETLFCGIGPAFTTSLFDIAELQQRRLKIELLRSSISVMVVSSLDGGREFTVRNDKSLNIDKENSRIVMKKGQVQDPVSGVHNGSCFSICRFLPMTLRNAKMMYSEFENCDFTGCDLSGFIASFSCFRNCTFAGSTLKNVKLNECSLQNTDFSELVLSESDFSGSDLSGVDFSGSDLSKSDLSRSRLIKTTFSGALLMGTNLTKCVMISCILDNQIMDETIAREAIFKNVSLKNITAKNVSMQRSCFIGCDLTGSDMEGYFDGVIFQQTECKNSTIIRYKEPENAFVEIWDGSGCHFTNIQSYLKR